MPVHKRKYESGKVAWRFVFNAPAAPGEERVQIAEAGFATKKEAQDAEAERRVAAQREFDLRRVHGVTEPLPKTLGDLITEFLAEHGEKRLAKKTLERYTDQAGMLDASLLAKPPAQVTALDLRREWNRLLTSGGRHRTTKNPRPLSAKTVRTIAGVVSSAYARGIEWGLVAVNPVAHSRPPVVRRRPGLALTSAQQRLLIDSAGRLAAFLELDAATGARRGELLATRWSDIVDGFVTIERSLSQTRAGLEFKETKNGKTNRIALPVSAVTAPASHRQAQEALRAQFGPDYRSDLDLVFCNSDGSPLKPNSVSSEVSILCRRLNLPKGASLHTLRHTHGSQLLEAGVSLADVSRRLGHSNVYVTATVYSHAISGNDSDVARK